MDILNYVKTLLEVIWNVFVYGSVTFYVLVGVLLVGAGILASVLITVDKIETKIIERRHNKRD